MPPTRAMCPLCHTANAALPNEIDRQDANTDWQCARCGHQWNAIRLATVAGYAAWKASREHQEHS